MVKKSLSEIVGNNKNPAAACTGAGFVRAAAAGRHQAYFTQLSLSVVTRLNTGLPATLSTRSATK